MQSYRDCRLACGRGLNSIVTGFHMSSYSAVIFDVAAAALMVLNVLLMATATSSSFKLWPTPSTKSWQHYTFGRCSAAASA